MSTSSKPSDKLLEEGKYQEALDKYLLIPKEGLSDEDRFNISLCHAGLKQNQKAIQILNELRKKGSDLPYLDYMLGGLYEKEKDISKATYFYKKGMQHKETFEDSKQAYDFLSQQKEIDEESDKIIELKPFKSDTTFADVVGLEEVKAKLFSKVILPLQHPELIKEYGKDYSCGIILYGSAGNGKTMLVRAIAGEAKCYMIPVKIRQIEGQFVGVTDKNLGIVFETARREAPCVIFIDEFDVLGGKRSSYGGDDERGGTNALKQAVNTLLDEMDGIEKNQEGIFIIAASNRPFDLDPALLREGRFGTSIYVPPPTKKERAASFRYNLSKKHKVAKHINYGRLARATNSFSQADIKGICNNAAELAIMHKYKTGKDVAITMGKILLAIKNYRSSSSIWFVDAKKELIGTYQTQVIDKKKHQIWKSAKLSPEEQIQYKEMIADVNKYAKSSGQMRFREFVRKFALYIG